MLVELADGACLTVTDQELLDFGLRPGEDLDQEALARLRAAAGASAARGKAAELIGRRAMSRAGLERRLREKGATEAEARGAAEWLEAIGALNDAEYAQVLARHCARQGYGPARVRDRLREKGVPRELWDAALEALPDPEELAVRFLEGKLRGRAPEEREKKRLSDALIRRGFSWGDVKAAWRRLDTEIDVE